jgi:adenylate cyclase
VEVQRSMADQNSSVPQDQRILFRIGIHVGDIIVDENDSRTTSPARSPQP